MQLSVVIRNKNQAKEMALCLASIKQQIVPFAYEIIVVDNNSSDNSIEIAKQFNCTLVHISDEEFTYGNALNKAIAHSKGEIIVIISSHIVLLSNHFLAAIPNIFVQADVAGARFIDVSNAASLKNSILQPVKKVYQTQKDTYINAWNNGTVNHCAAIRKSVWQQIPYCSNVFYSEDKIWSYKVLAAGYAIQINNPLYYKYNRELNRQQLLKRRSLEAAAYQLFTKSNKFVYPYSIGGSYRFLGRQLKSVFFRLHAYFWVRRSSRKIIKQHQHHFHI
jgi:rhamnosyltransferase